MTDAGSLEWRYADDLGVGADDTTNVMTLTDGRRVETPAQLLAILTEWHHDLGTPTTSELDNARRILPPETPSTVGAHRGRGGTGASRV